MVLKLAVNTMTFNVQSVDLLKMVQAISKAGFTGVDMRDSHIQDHLRKDHSIQEIKNLLDEHRLHPIAIHALRNWQDEEGKRGKAYRKAVEQYFALCKGMGCDFGVCAAWGDDSDLEKDVQGLSLK